MSLLQRGLTAWMYQMMQNTQMHIHTHAYTHIHFTRIPLGWTPDMAWPVWGHLRSGGPATLHSAPCCVQYHCTPAPWKSESALFEGLAWQRLGWSCWVGQLCTWQAPWCGIAAKDAYCQSHSGLCTLLPIAPVMYIYRPNPSLEQLLHCMKSVSSPLITAVLRCNHGLGILHCKGVAKVMKKTVFSALAGAPYYLEWWQAPITYQNGKALTMS